MRVKFSTGEVHLRISSTALSMSAGSATSRSRSAGNWLKARRPPAIAFRVVSLPATINSTQNINSSSLVSSETSSAR